MCGGWIVAACCRCCLMRGMRWLLLFVIANVVRWLLVVVACGVVVCCSVLFAVC